MSSIVRIKVNNYRSLVNLSIGIDSINILFGPNGAGKSSFLDILWFVRDCANRGVDLASSYRSHGIGILWDCAENGEPVSIMISTNKAEYELSFGFSSGRIEPFVGEYLYSRLRKTDLIRRNIGSDKVQFHHVREQDFATVTLREPQKISLGRYLDFEEAAHEAANLDRLLIEQTGPSSVYGSFIEKGRRAPIRASGVSDGHLQMLLLLTALFAEGKQRESLFGKRRFLISGPGSLQFTEAISKRSRSGGKPICVSKKPCS